MNGFFDSGSNSRVAITNPTVSDDATKGYSPGYTWANSATNTVYYCISAAIGAAVWVALGASFAVGFGTTGYFGVDSYGATTDYGSYTSEPGSIV
jgi:hypothetical protein